ncbi:kinesin-like protein KIN-14I [Solanum stenotomum]|uniref:kinesin-like protein KIN-14I n=1 Tax=Solanum stenotomum TaxID=172797 RepID=UPI0020D0CDE2|nr:kinesin-like protein KIN-14I [Solanum stenotomum]
MGTEEGIVQISVASVVEEVLQQGKGLSDIDLASRKAEEASLRRYVAAGWLRKTIGVVAAKDLPAEPSEEDFRLGLRSGIVLCNVLNKVQPGAVQKVVEAPPDSVNVPDGAALSAYQYFENVRNFLVAVEEMGIPSFEASDLEKGGKSSRIINCVLALKSYSEWKHGGGSGSWKYSGNSKPSSAGKQFVRRNSEPFMNLISRTSSIINKSPDSSDVGHEAREMVNPSSLQMLVHDLLSDKKQEDIPFIVENMLSKVMEEFEHRLASQNEQSKTSHKETVVPTTDESPLELTCEETQVAIIEDEEKTPDEGTCGRVDIDDDGASTTPVVRQLMLVEHQHKEVQQLKSTLHDAKVDLQSLQLKYQEEVSNLGKHLHGLAHTASSYQKVLEENRKLYNQVQDLKGNIRVYCRVRPFLPGQPNSLSTVDHLDDGNITITTPSKYGKEGKKSFTFNKVFGPSGTQEEVFADTQPLIRSVLDGYNVCIFAYGQTGSGKTHTMTGPSDLTKETLGVNYRALSDLFNISEQRKDVISYDISVQMVEIYNEQVRDLLTPDGVNKKVEIRNSSQKGFNVPDANLVPVTSTSDVLNLMNLGHKNRAVSATAMNDRSSRSHSCLTVHVQGKNMTSGTILRGSMHLVDLAGSERVDKSEVLGDRLKEATHINKSLSALGDVIASLAQKNSHVPYRNSKLTQLLQDSLGGQAKTLMFVHVSPELNAVGETLSTLKFAERVSTVELGSARANKEGSDVKELREQISSLKAALARKEEDQGRRPLSRSSTPERVRVGSSGSSLSSSWHSMEDVSGNIEVKKKSTSKMRRRSLDPKDFQTNSPLSPPGNNPVSMEEDRESVSGDWVDKIMVNKQDGLSRSNSLRGWEEETRISPDLLYRKCPPDSSKVYPEQHINKVAGNIKEGQDYEASRTRSEAGSIDDFDDLEAATSESSELEYGWQPNPQKVSQTPNGLGSKLRKPSPKQVKKPEIRSLIPPPPTRRLSNGLISPSAKMGRAAALEGKRKTASGKW